MDRKCLSKNYANINDIDIYIRDNVHQYEAFIYGLQQDLNLSADITMKLTAMLEIKQLFRLVSDEISMNFSAESLTTEILSFMRSSIDMRFQSIIDAQIQKSILTSIKMDLNSIINITVLSILRAKELTHGFIIGTLETDRTLYDIKELYLNDISEMTLSELCIREDKKYGLSVYVKE